MSAPLVVNTTDGTCWTRREGVRDGQALYAPEKCDRCPEFVMATYTELEEHGIAGEAYALPVPGGPEREAQSLPLKVVVELNDLRMRLAGMANPPREVFLALYEGAEPELFATVEAARECCDDLATVDAHGKCWDWIVNEYGVHVQFWTHPDDDRPTGETSGTVTPVVVQGAEPLSELETLQARVAELEAERHTTNEALDDAVKAVRERDGRIAELEAAQGTVYRASHDSIVRGLYATAAEARKHCETELRREYAESTKVSLWWREDEDTVDQPEDGEAELFAHVIPRGMAPGHTWRTGYVVTALEVASEYDEEADE